jgi:hypothetical protein
MAVSRRMICLRLPASAASDRLWHSQVLATRVCRPELALLLVGGADRGGISFGRRGAWRCTGAGKPTGGLMVEMAVRKFHHTR